MDATVTAFIDCINRHDVAGIARLMTRDHVFIDSLGNRIEGAEVMQQGWAQYLATVPDYRIEIEGHASSGDTVLLHGLAAGTLAHDGRMRPDSRWQVTAAWRAVVRGGRIALWQVFCDNKRMHELLAGG